MTVREPIQRLPTGQLWQQAFSLVVEGFCPICVRRLRPSSRDTELAECECCTGLYGANLIVIKTGPTLVNSGRRLKDRLFDEDWDGEPRDRPCAGRYCSGCDRWESEPTPELIRQLRRSHG